MGQHKQDIDCGWAWVVMVSSYLGMLVFCIAMYMNGVLYVALLERFQEGEAKTALVGAISIGLQCFAPLLAGVINNKFNCRVSIVLGGVLTTVGFTASAFVNSIDLLIVTTGVCVGTGYGLSASGLICVVGFYFEKWRNVVISIAFLAVGLAMFISSPLGLLLLNTYGLTATYFILAGLEAQLCVLGMLCRPSSIETEVHMKRKLNENEKSKSKAVFDLTLLRNKSYLLFLMSSTTWTFALSSAVMHLPNYMYVLGGTSRDIGILMTSFSVANVCGRLFGVTTVSKMTDKIVFVHATVLALAGVITSLFFLYSKWTVGVYVFAIQLGIFTGWPNAMMTPISLSFVGVAKLSEAYGLTCSFCGIGVTSGPVLSGYLYGVTRSYDYSFVVAGLVLLVGSFFGVCSLCCRSPKEEQKTDLVLDLGDSNHITRNGEIERSNELQVLNHDVSDLKFAEDHMETKELLCNA